MDDSKITPIKRGGGPVTARGKENSSRNSLKHGLFSKKTPILSCEESEFLDGLLQSLVAEYVPQTPTEVLLVQEIAMGWFRLYKLWDAEAAAANQAGLEAELAHRFPNVSERASSFLDRMNRPKHEKAEIELLEKGIISTAKVAASVPDTDKYMQYEKHISRQLHNAIDRLKKLQLSYDS